MRGLGLGIAALFLATAPLQAMESLSFLTSWKAQPEHGGYYQAVAKGFYKACGLDLALKQGGPGLDGKQLLVAGSVDILMASFNDTAFLLNAAGFPAKGVMAIFQKNPQILMAHAGSGINSFEDMKGKPISISAGARTTYWPFLQARFGFTDAQLRSYTGQLAPWFSDKTGITQALITNEPHRVEVETHEKPTIFLLADNGYDAYSSVAVVSQKLIETKPAAIQCFVDASIKGWVDFLKDPAPAVALIRKDNPDNPEDVVDYAIKVMKDTGLIESSETAQYGVGTMSDERWKKHGAMLQATGIIPPGADYKQSFTLQFVNHRVGM